VGWVHGVVVGIERLYGEGRGQACERVMKAVAAHVEGGDVGVGGEHAQREGRVTNLDAAEECVDLVTTDDSAGPCAAVASIAVVDDLGGQVRI